MQPEHVDVYERTLHVLLTKIEVLISLLKRLVKPQAGNGNDGDANGYTVKRLKYAFKKDSLDQAIEEFETWQRTADPPWFLLLRIADSGVDDALKPDNSTVATEIPSALTIRSNLQDETARGSGLSRSPQELRKMKQTAIPHSDAWVAIATNSSGRTSTYILNKIPCQLDMKYQIVQKDVRDLARRLQHSDPQTFGLMTCKGFVKDSSPSDPDQSVQFTVLFVPPPNHSNPRSLRDRLLNSTAPASLTLRLAVAQQLAKSVGYVHNFGFVHKNVRPESVMGFDTVPYEGTVPAVFLVGFENFRRDQGQTHRQGDEALERNLYRHPSRQGTSPREDYIMQHDIYSLGVCLLEIGFWESFVNLGSQLGGTHASSLLGLPAKASAAQISEYLQTSAKDHLLSLARSNLPEKMGQKYADIVETCLTCLDEENGDFGDASEFEDEDGILIGARYIDKVSTTYRCP